MTASETAALYDAPIEQPSVAMLHLYPAAWRCRRLHLPATLWQRLTGQARTAYLITMHDHTHQMVVW